MYVKFQPLIGFPFKKAPFPWTPVNICLIIRYYVKFERHHRAIFMSTASSREREVFYLIHDRIIDDANHRDFPNGKSNGNTDKREPTETAFGFVFVNELCRT